MAFKVTPPSSKSKTLDRLMGAEGPPPLADQQMVPTGPLEVDFRASKKARRDAMQATKDDVRIDSEPANITGPLPKAKTTTQTRERRF